MDEYWAQGQIACGLNLLATNWRDMLTTRPTFRLSAICYGPEFGSAVEMARRAEDT